MEAIEVLLRSRRRAPAEGTPPHPNEADTEHLPWIDAGQENLRIITAEAWEASLRANEPMPRYFCHGGELVRLERDDEHRLVTADLTMSRLRHASARTANWYREDEETGARRLVKPPIDVVYDVLV